MSLLSRDELNIVLAPERVALLRTERTLTMQGYHRSVRASKVCPCENEGGGEMPWSRAIDTLGTALPSIIVRKMDVNVILSNHFMHYTLVPWFDKLSDEEEMVLAQHYFSETYGSAADSLSVRVSPGRAGTAALASAVDTRLLDDLNGLLGRMRLNIKSIQPHLMVAYNSCSESLSGRSAWIVLLEPGSLCLSVLRKGQLVWIRKLRLEGDWHNELPPILEREAYLADTDVAMDEVFLWAPHLDEPHIPEGWRWKIRQLQPSFKPGYKAEYGGLFNLEMGQ